MLLNKGSKVGEIFSTTVAGDPMTVEVVEDKSGNGCEGCAFLNENSEGQEYCQRPEGLESCTPSGRNDKKYIIYKEVYNGGV